MSKESEKFTSELQEKYNNMDHPPSLDKIKNDSLMNLSNSKDMFVVGLALKEFIKKNKLSTNIQGKEYAHVDAWKFAGSMFGLTAIPEKPDKKHESGEMMRISYAMVTRQGRNGPYQKEEIVYYGYIHDSEGYRIATTGKHITKELVKPHFAYECGCDVIRLSDREVVSSGTGFCSNLEASKAMFDEYSVNSTAQTRSIGKAYRNILGYIMNEAGYEATPKEEMEEDHIKESIGSKEPTPTKPKMTKDQVNGTLLAINKGAITSIDDIEEHFYIDDDQRASFTSLFSLQG